MHKLEILMGYLCFRVEIHVLARMVQKHIGVNVCHHLNSGNSKSHSLIRQFQGKASPVEIVVPSVPSKNAIHIC